MDQKNESDICKDKTRIKSLDLKSTQPEIVNDPKQQSTKLNTGKLEIGVSIDNYTDPKKSSWKDSRKIKSSHIGGTPNQSLYLLLRNCKVSPERSVPLSQGRFLKSGSPTLNSDTNLAIPTSNGLRTSDHKRVKSENFTDWMIQCSRPKNRMDWIDEYLDNDALQKHFSGFFDKKQSGTGNKLYTYKRDNIENHQGLTKIVNKLNLKDHDRAKIKAKDWSFKASYNKMKQKEKIECARNTVNLSKNIGNTIKSIHQKGKNYLEADEINHLVYKSTKNKNIDLTNEIKSSQHLATNMKVLKKDIVETTKVNNFINSNKLIKTKDGMMDEPLVQYNQTHEKFNNIQQRFTIVENENNSKYKGMYYDKLWFNKDKKQEKDKSSKAKDKRTDEGQQIYRNNNIYKHKSNNNIYKHKSNKNTNLSKNKENRNLEVKKSSEKYQYNRKYNTKVESGMNSNYPCSFNQLQSTVEFNNKNENILKSRWISPSRLKDEDKKKIIKHLEEKKYSKLKGNIFLAQCKDSKKVEKNTISNENNKNADKKGTNAKSRESMHKRIREEGQYQGQGQERVIEIQKKYNRFGESRNIIESAHNNEYFKVENEKIKELSKESPKKKIENVLKNLQDLRIKLQCRVNPFSSSVKNIQLVLDESWVRTDHSNQLWAKNGSKFLRNQSVVWLGWDSDPESFSLSLSNRKKVNSSKQKFFEKSRRVLHKLNARTESKHSKHLILDRYQESAIEQESNMNNFNDKYSKNNFICRNQFQNSSAKIGFDSLIYLGSRGCSQNDISYKAQQSVRPPINSKPRDNSPKKQTMDQKLKRDTLFKSSNNNNITNILSQKNVSSNKKVDSENKKLKEIITKPFTKKSVNSRSKLIKKFDNDGELANVAKKYRWLSGEFNDPFQDLLSDKDVTMPNPMPHHHNQNQTNIKAKLLLNEVLLPQPVCSPMNKELIRTLRVIDFDNENKKDIVFKDADKLRIDDQLKNEKLTDNADKDSANEKNISNWRPFKDTNNLQKLIETNKKRSKWINTPKFLNDIKISDPNYSRNIYLNERLNSRKVSEQNVSNPEFLHNKFTLSGSRLNYLNHSIDKTASKKVIIASDVLEDAISSIDEKLVQNYKNECQSASMKDSIIVGSQINDSAIKNMMNSKNSRDSIFSHLKKRCKELAQSESQERFYHIKENNEEFAMKIHDIQLSQQHLQHYSQQKKCQHKRLHSLRPVGETEIGWLVKKPIVATIYENEWKNIKDKDIMNLDWMRNNKIYKASLSPPKRTQANTLYDHLNDAVNHTSLNASKLKKSFENVGIVTKSDKFFPAKGMEIPKKSRFWSNDRGLADHLEQNTSWKALDGNLYFNYNIVGKKSGEKILEHDRLDLALYHRKKFDKFIEEKKIYDVQDNEKIVLTIGNHLFVSLQLY